MVTHYDQSGWISLVSTQTPLRTIWAGSKIKGFRAGRKFHASIKVRANEPVTMALREAAPPGHSEALFFQFSPLVIFNCVQLTRLVLFAKLPCLVGTFVFAVSIETFKTIQRGVYLE